MGFIFIIGIDTILFTFTIINYIQAVCISPGYFKKGDCDGKYDIF